MALFDAASQRRELVFRTRRAVLTTDECAAVLQEVCDAPAFTFHLVFMLIISVPGVWLSEDSFASACSDV